MYDVISEKFLYRFKKRVNPIIMKKKKFLNIVIGFLAGVISGFFGAGGGLLLVPYMTGILKEKEVTARATCILCIFFMVLMSSFFYFNKNAIDWWLAIQCAVGGVIGSYIGSKLLIKLNHNILQILFIFFLLYAGVSMIIK